MLRALFLNRDLEYHGGVSNVLLTLARGVDRNRADFQFGSLMDPSAATRDAFKQLGIELLCIGDQGYAKPAKVLRRYLKKEKIDFVVASAFKAALVAKAAAVGLPCRVVHYIHAVDLVLEGNFKRKLFALISRNDPMLFVSKTVERAHRPASHKGPAAVAYNGVRDPFGNPATHPYPREFRRELGVPDDALLLAYIGAFVGWKDHTTTLKAFQLLDLALNAHLLLIGKGEPGSTVEEQVKQINNPRIQIVSPRPDARQILGAVDVYVHSSRREGFGLAVVEAMLAGRPIVATREGAFTEYIEDGRTGLLAEPGDPASFAEKIQVLARDPEFARRMAAAGQHAAKERFDPAGCARVICDFLDRCKNERKM
ncbi:MAG TPA: glycosyltransferase family 4 protein [Tepidisphaeraceae bacterium]|nr:glycosyltransferase family 4 protein [Tepidisphaeraceae bacterium]